MNVLRSRGLWGGLALLALTLVVWFIGPLLTVAEWRPLESMAVRGWLIGLVTVSALLRAGWTRRQLGSGLPVRGAARRRPGRWSLAAIALLHAGVLVAWGVGYVRQRAHVADVASRVDALHEQLRREPASAFDDPAVILPALQSVRDIARTAAGDDVGYAWGLSQAVRLDAAVQKAYRRLLRDALWPRLARRIELRLRADSADTEQLYEVLKAYLMMFDPAHFDRQAMESFVSIDWARHLARKGGGSTLASLLEEHLAALFADGALPAPFAADLALVNEVRARVAALPLVERVHERMRRLSTVERDLPGFDILKVAGPDAGSVFVRARAAPLGQGVPGLYTKDGYQKALRRIDKVAGDLAAEQAWVLGESPAGPTASALATPALADEARRRYLNDYARTWQAYIADLRLAPTNDLAALVKLARVLSGPDSMLRPMLKAMSRETSLLGTVDATARAGTDPSKDRASLARVEIQKLLGRSAEASDAPKPEQIVDDRFAGLRRLLAVPEGRTQAPLDDVLAQLDALYRWLFAAHHALGSGEAPPRSDLPLQLRAEAARLPEPLRSWLDDLGARSEVLAANAASKRK